MSDRTYLNLLGKFCIGLPFNSTDISRSKDPKSSSILSVL